MTDRQPAIHAFTQKYSGRAALLISEAGVPRNAPCPCGKTYPNGKAVKFKDCHGAG